METQKKCEQCGPPMKAVSPREWTYSESGLEGVTLVNVPVSECSFCDNEVVEIPRIEYLHQVMARELAQKVGRLMGPEIRALRSHMGLEKKALALLLNESEVKLSRAETGDWQMEVGTELALRYLVLAFVRGTNDPLLERMKEVAQAVATSAPPAPLRMRLVFQGQGWYSDRREVPS